MSGGRKVMVINTLERAVSTDQNRAQAFAQAGMAEHARYMLDVFGNDDLDAGGVVTEPTTLETPMRAEIVNGLLVRPQAGSFSLFIDPGVMWALAPDSGADDSNYKFVKDPGVQTLGSLVMAGNAAGSVRIDVIECQVTNVVTETDNRDVFSPSTGTFTATTVTKARQSTCTFVNGANNVRVRQGTAGAGYPGNVSGWLPLAVASVPGGGTVTSNDQITFWDVRPLVNDRAFQPFALTPARNKLTRQLVNAGVLTTAAGIIEGTFNGRRIGGRLRSGTPQGADAELIDLTDASNTASGNTFVANHPWYLYMVVPFSLPRWARYTVSAPRQPRSPRGIPVVSAIAPLADGSPSAPIPLPTACGLGGSTLAAYCVASGPTITGPAQKGFFATETGTTLDGTQNLPTLTVNNASPDWTATLTGGVDFPAHASELMIEVTANFQSSATSAQAIGLLEVSVPGGGTFVAGDQYLYVKLNTTNPGTYWTGFVAKVKLPTTYPATAAPVYTLKLHVGTMTNLSFDTLPVWRIIGWKLGE